MSAREQRRLRRNFIKNSIIEEGVLVKADPNAVHVELDVHTIGPSAFEGCTRLQSVEAPRVHTIEEYAFIRCTGIVNITFPKLQTIGEGAFWGCASLVDITFPDTLQTVGKQAFWGCGLITVDLPPTLLNIGLNAFQCRRRIEFDNLNDVTQYLIASNLKPRPQSSDNRKAHWKRFYTKLQDDYFYHCAVKTGDFHVAVTKVGTLYTIISDNRQSMQAKTYDSTQCPICLDPLLGKKWTRACGHNICIPCAEGLYTHSGPAPCPLCREEPIVDFGNKSKLRF